MGPKKNKRKNDDQDDQEFLSKQKNVEEMLKQITKKSNKNKKNQNEDQDSQNQQQLITRKKQTFDYDFSNQKALIEHQKKQEQIFKEKQQKERQAKQLTLQEKIQLQKKLEKQKQQKEKKQKKKQQKKVERLKQVQEQKVKLLQQKEQQQKQQEEVKKKLNQPKASGKCIPIFLLSLIIILCALQYQKQFYVRLSKFKLEGQENFYQTLQIDSGATDRQLKEKYKRLVLKYHPDKNPNCKQCQQKFNKIIIAWQVLGSPQKRKHYDANSGFVTRIKSQSITLTPVNYNQIYSSRSLWLIQVYDSTQKYCHYFSQFWQDTVKQYNQYIKFGRVDIWTQSDMLSYLPYSFQVFPSIYYVHKGQIGLCQFQFDKPDWSLKRCIEGQYKENLVKGINSVEEIQSNQKNSVVLGDKIKLGSKFKIINKKYQNDFDFYSLKGSLNSQQIIIKTKNGRKTTYNLSQKDSQFYKKYEKILQSLILQKISICQLINTCQNTACYILTSNQPSASTFTLPQQPLQSMHPIYLIQDQQFFLSLQQYKNKTSQSFQKFQIGLYQNGHLDLGYLDQFMLLNAEEGESFNQLKCVYKDNSVWGRMMEMVGKVTGMVGGMGEGV